jgi:dethiobiotin synthetase
LLWDALWLTSTSACHTILGAKNTITSIDYSINSAPEHLLLGPDPTPHKEKFYLILQTAFHALFISGTDTNIGKTVVSAWLALHWPAAYWKPVQSGTDEADDNQLVAQLSGAYCYPSLWQFKAPLSPHQAALDENREINLAQLHLPHAAASDKSVREARKTSALRENGPLAQHLVIEGAGGVLTPLNASESMVDLIAQLHAPILLVVRSGLGTINHSCLTVEALRARNLSVLGLVMVGIPNALNQSAVEHYAQVPVLAVLPWLEQLTRTALAGIPLPHRLRRALASLPGRPAPS